MEKLESLTKDLEDRIKAAPHQSQSRKLAQADARDIIEVAASFLVVGISKESTLVNLIAQIGSRVQNKMGMKRDSVVAARFGAFILESFETAGLFKRVLEPNGKNEAYYVHADDEVGLSEIWELIAPEKIEHIPSFTPAEDWTTGIHSTGLPMVRHAPRSVLNLFNPEDHELLFHVLNENQKVGWMINQEVFKIYVSCLNDKLKGEFEGSFVFGHYDPEEKRRKVRSGKRREADNIRIAARKVGKEIFYHQYNTCFRGRVYPNTAFLNEQSSDNAKGILLMAAGGELGEHGEKWMAIQATNCWGEDKLSLVDRELYAYSNRDEWIKYAQDPLANRGWMKADKCWSFLASCFEFMYLREWVRQGNTAETFVTHLPSYIDGTNNGCQHLIALSLDETVAHLVNLVPSSTPGDIYMHIAEKAWELVEKDYDPDLDDALIALMAETAEMNERWSAVTGATKEIKKEKRKVLTEESKAYRLENSALIKSLAPNYWKAVVDPKQRRKVCKRPVMCLGYGATQYGFKTQILEDTKSINAYFRNIQYAWAQAMGDTMYHVCMGKEELGIKAELPGPAAMLSLFETLALRSVDDGKKFGWTVPFNNFPVVQQYKSPETKRVQIMYMGERLLLTIKIMEKQYIKRSKQKTAAAPNVIHSFDAAHLMMTVGACPFQTATIHDSFGCLPGDMEDMFAIVREQFARFYEADPLEELLYQQDSLDLMPDRGTLDVREITKSDFAFS